jgi:hypothetical protein
MLTIINNYPNPIHIGKSLAYNNTPTEVSAKDYEAFAKTPMGGNFIKAGHISIVDPNAQTKADLDRLALANAIRGELEPVIRKEMEVKYKAEIEALKTQLAEKKKIDIKPETSKGKPVESVEESAKADFVFNPEIHSIEHRGAGQWFVMEGEKKVYGALTPEERTKFDTLMKG